MFPQDYFCEAEGQAELKESTSNTQQLPWLNSDPTGLTVGVDISGRERVKIIQPVIAQCCMFRKLGKASAEKNQQELRTKILHKISYPLD